MSSSAVHQAIDEVLERAVASGAVPNVVAIAADREGIIYECGVGPRSPGAQGDVDGDTRFRIMSMTKAIVTTAALVLVEQYKLDLDAPVEEYCPEFAEVRVLERIEHGRPVLRAPRSKATVKQLVTHTSGLGYWFWNAPVLAWERAVGAATVMSGRAGAFDVPMVSEPGSAFVYGFSSEWLGRVVQAASGRALDDAVRFFVTEPLAMTETGFTITPEQRAELVPVHLADPAGRWAASEIELPPEPEYWSGGHGLYSTPRDYLTFQRMLLGDGTSPDGVTVLSRDTVGAAFANQIGALDFPADIPTADPASTFGLHVGPGHKWGYGLLVNTSDLPGRRRAGSGAWAGFFNTHFWVDRSAGLTGAIYAQMLPFIPPAALRMYQDFETALYASR
jgi:CubicO group peptidase (beta-lactamase class C family)